jgi:hypothetical protein
MKRFCFAFVLLFCRSLAGAQDAANDSDAQRMAAAYAKLAAAQQAPPATRPTNPQLEIQKLRQEVAQLQDQVEALKAENNRLRVQLGLAIIPADGKPRTDYEQRMQKVLDQMQWSQASRQNDMAKAAAIDKALNAWCAANSPDSDTADALWNAKVEVGMPWSGVAITGSATLESETADGQIYKFIPFFDDRDLDIVMVQNGKIASIKLDRQP